MPQYEKTFGASSVLDRKARARMYKAILDSIEREKVRREGQASRSKVVAAEKKKADAKLRAKNRTAKEKRDDERARQFRKFVSGETGREGRVTTATGFDCRKRRIATARKTQ